MTQAATRRRGATQPAAANGLDGVELRTPDGPEDVASFRVLHAGARVWAQVQTVSGRTGIASIRAEITDKLICEVGDTFDVIAGDDGRENIVRRPRP